SHCGTIYWTTITSLSHHHMPTGHWTTTTASPVTSASSIAYHTNCFLIKMDRYFPKVSAVQYRPDSGPEDTQVFKHYNPQESVHGRSMEEWFNFAPCYFNSFRYTGGDDFLGDRAHLRFREWEDKSDQKALDPFKQRMKAAFQKLGVKFYAASDRDFGPDCGSFEDTSSCLDEMVSLACELQSQAGVKPLYFAADLFTSPRYINGAASSPDISIYTYACAQVKRALDMAKRLNAANFVFFHPRDGYQHSYLRYIFRDLAHMAHFYRMVLQYCEKIDYHGQLLIQPKPQDPRRHQYESDAAATMHTLRHFGLERQFRLYIKPAWSAMMNRVYEHDIYIAAAYNMLGMVDASECHQELDTTSDMHAKSIRQCTAVMKVIIEQGGLQQGGFVLGGRLQRESLDANDLFLGHILTMDTYARALKTAARIISDAVFSKNLQQKYLSYKTGFGERLDKGSTNLEECVEHVRSNGEPNPKSEQFEHFDSVWNYYVFPKSR
ncbi:unnamed protein product, partial [Meganyctiphanes norvegica]